MPMPLFKLQSSSRMGNRHLVKLQVRSAIKVNGEIKMRVQRYVPFGCPEGHLSWLRSREGQFAATLLEDVLP